MNYEKFKFKTDDIEITVNVSPEEDTIWLSTSDMCVLFGKDKSTISRHVKTAISELSKAEQGVAKNGQSVAKIYQSVAKSATVSTNGKVYEMTHYNLDVVLFVGRKLKSKITELFNSWCKDVLANLKGKSEIESNIIRFDNGIVALDVNISPEENTVWLSRNQIAILFETTRQNIATHIKNIIEEGELNDASVSKKNLHTDCSVHKDFLYTDNPVVKNSLNTETTIQKEILCTSSDGKQYLVTYYNLLMILAVGYRVKSNRAIEFRNWASSVLHDYIMKGYAIDKNRIVVSQENYQALKDNVLLLNSKMAKLEENEKHNFIKDLMISDGQLFDALYLMSKITEIAKETIVLFDPYVNIKSLYMIRNIDKRLKYTIITSDYSKVVQNDLDIFAFQYGEVKVYKSNVYHDRYLIIDDTTFYHLGGSVNHLGNKVSQITLVEEEDIKTLLRNRLKNLTSQ